jgi:hypothetical protein
VRETNLIRAFSIVAVAKCVMIANAVDEIAFDYVSVSDKQDVTASDK